MSDARRALRRTDLTGALVLAAMTGAAYFGGLEPMMRAKQARAALLQQVESERSDSLELGATIAMLRRERDALLAELDRSARRLHPISYQNERLAAITSLAAESGLIVDEVHPGQATFGPRYGTMPVRIHARGDFARCAQFLNQLAEYPDLGISALRLSGAPADPHASPMLIVELVWYVLPSVKRP